MHEIYNYVSSNPKTEENLTGILQLALGYEPDFFMVDSLFNTFPLAIQRSPKGTYFRNLIDKPLLERRRVNYRTSVLNEKLINIYGQNFTLADINAKYLLIDFWAAWCVPCRHANRELENKKQQIEAAGLVKIVGISADSSAVKWRKAFEVDKLSYINGCDLQQFESPIFREFGIVKIPQNVLIDKSGNIIARDLWGDEAVRFISQLE